MKALAAALLLVLAAPPLPSSPPPSATVADHLGLQMYSLRATAAQKGWRAALDEAGALGFRYIESGGPPAGVAARDYDAQISARRLRLVSEGFSYEQLQRDLAGAVDQARSLGVRYAMVAWIPHKDADPFTDGDARRAASDFDAWGAAFRAAGIVFAYHPHGYEFRPDRGGGTPFDVLVRSTHPEFVSFELDVFWAVHGGQDPAALLAKYPDRWSLMHVKDIRKGARTGIFTGHAPGTDDVAVGTGQVDWPRVFREARAVGVEWYFIEDESPTPLENIPRSVAYVQSLGL